MEFLREYSKTAESVMRVPRLHDRSSTESGSPSAILLCRTSANNRLMRRSNFTVYRAGT